MEKKSNLGRGLHLRAACSAILTLSTVIGITVHQKTLARQTPKAQDSRITVRYTDVRQSAGITFRQDRKSTRLNSSHSQISYAAFCLKKKTASGQEIENALPDCARVTSQLVK